MKRKRGWTFDHILNGFTTKVPVSEIQVSPTLTAKYGDVFTQYGEVTLNLLELEAKGCIRKEGANYFRIRVWHDGRQYYVSPTKGSSPKHWLGIKHDLAT